MNHDGCYDDLGGQPSQDDSTDAWDVGGAIYGPCGECGAKVHERCTVQTAAGRRERKMPCLNRIKGAKNAS